MYSIISLTAALNFIITSNAQFTCISRSSNSTINTTAGSEVYISCNQTLKETLTDCGFRSVSNAEENVGGSYHYNDTTATSFCVAKTRNRYNAGDNDPPLEGAIAIARCCQLPSTIDCTSLTGPVLSTTDSYKSYTTCSTGDYTTLTGCSVSRAIDIDIADINNQPVIQGAYSTVSTDTDNYITSSNPSAAPSTDTVQCYAQADSTDPVVSGVYPQLTCCKTGATTPLNCTTVYGDPVNLGSEPFTSTVSCESVDELMLGCSGWASVPGLINAWYITDSPSTSTCNARAAQSTGGTKVWSAAICCIAPTAEPTVTPTTISPTFVPTNAPSLSPTNYPSTAPSHAPSFSPSYSPSRSPSGNPTTAPSLAPSNTPSSPPSTAPSASPSLAPSYSPSYSPTDAPSDVPSSAPSRAPSSPPSNAPSNAPSSTPSSAPSSPPTAVPSNAPSSTPSTAPSYSPTSDPSGAPSYSPTDAPSDAPSLTPTNAPSRTPSAAPSNAPSRTPSLAPTTSPLAAPSNAPSRTPSDAPSVAPSTPPTTAPTIAPTQIPTYSPTPKPTKKPTPKPSGSIDPTASPSTARPTRQPTVADVMVVFTFSPELLAYIAVGFGVTGALACIFGGLQYCIVYECFGICGNKNYELSGENKVDKEALIEVNDLFNENINDKKEEEETPEPSNKDFDQFVIETQTESLKGNKFQE